MAQQAIKSEETEEFREWLKQAVDGKVQKVEISTRLVDSPATLVQSAYGMSPTMQRYMKAQAVAMGEENGMFGGGMVSRCHFCNASLN
jgi:HSP90 family molecular chaperone